jgi:hypothetical protein
MKRWVLTVTAAAISAIGVHAHHSISGAYDTSQRMTIEGVVSEFQFVNPHPFLLIDVRAETGAAQPWRLEMDNRNELSRIGVTGQTLRTGDRVVVSGSPARTQAQSLYVYRLDRPADGFRYEQIGSSPRIRAGRQE